MQTRFLILLTVLAAGILSGCNSDPSSKEPPLAHQIEEEKAKTNDLNFELNQIEEEHYQLQETVQIARDDHQARLAELSLLKNDVARKQREVADLQQQAADLKAELDRILESN